LEIQQNIIRDQLTGNSEETKWQNRYIRRMYREWPDYDLRCVNDLIVTQVTYICTLQDCSLPITRATVL